MTGKRDRMDLWTLSGASALLPPGALTDPKIDDRDRRILAYISAKVGQRTWSFFTHKEAVEQLAEAGARKMHEDEFGRRVRHLRTEGYIATFKWQRGLGFTPLTYFALWKLRPFFIDGQMPSERWFYELSAPEGGWRRIPRKLSVRVPTDPPLPVPTARSGRVPTSPSEPNGSGSPALNSGPLDSGNHNNCVPFGSGSEARKPGRGDEQYETPETVAARERLNAMLIAEGLPPMDVEALRVSEEACSEGPGQRAHEPEGAANLTEEELAEDEVRFAEQFRELAESCEFPLTASHRASLSQMSEFLRFADLDRIAVELDGGRRSWQFFAAICRRVNAARRDGRDPWAPSAAARTHKGARGNARSYHGSYEHLVHRDYGARRTPSAAAPEPDEDEEIESPEALASHLRMEAMLREVGISLADYRTPWDAVDQTAEPAPIPLIRPSPVVVVPDHL